MILQEVKQSNRLAQFFAVLFAFLFASLALPCWLHSAKQLQAAAPVIEEVREGTGNARIRTDRSVYPKPPLPPLPRAGGKFRDPVFGTEIMRATDESDCPVPGCGTWYNQWPTFNANNTRLLIRNGDSGEMMIKAFDPVNFALGPIVRGSPKVGRTTPNWQGAMWSRTDPDLIFVEGSYYDPNLPASGMKLYSYRPSTNTFTMVKDFAPRLSPGHPDYLFELHMDAHDDVFCFMQFRVGDPDNPLYYIVWKRSTDQVLLYIRNDQSLDANTCIPDKSGRWIFFPLNKVQADKSAHKIWDSQTNTWQTVYWTAADDSPSHGDLGTGIMAGFGNFSGGPNLRSLSNVHKSMPVFDYRDANGKVDWSNEQHMTLYADDESWATMAVYGEPRGATGPFKGEVLQFAMDGSQRIRRLFHHRSVIDNLTRTTGYWGIPKQTISRDGRFIAFTSNWENSGRYDLFIARIDPAPHLAKAPLATPTDSPAKVVRQRWVTQPAHVGRPQPRN
jgi:hypothetical protein